MQVLKDCEVPDAILFLIASHTSLMQVHTKATDTPNKFPIVRYSTVGARWYKAIASRRFGVTAFRIGVSCWDISSPISRRIDVKLMFHGLLLSWNTKVNQERMLRPCRTTQKNRDASILLFYKSDFESGAKKLTKFRISWTQFFILISYFQTGSYLFCYCI